MSETRRPSLLDHALLDEGFDRTMGEIQDHDKKAEKFIRLINRALDYMEVVKGRGGEVFFTDPDFANLRMLSESLKFHRMKNQEYYFNQTRIIIEKINRFLSCDLFEPTRAQLLLLRSNIEATLSTRE
jgi:hypothetical protein